MNTYRVWVQSKPWDDEWCVQEVQAATSGKAKYAYWHYLQDGLWEEPFGEVVRHLRCKLVGKFKVSDLFGNPDSFAHVIKMRNLPFAYMGMRIEVAGQMGTIVGSNRSGNLDVCFDGRHYGENCHPWWETRYFDRNGNVIRDYRSIAKEVI
ncbi:hypothetical protein [Paenibacillus cymbidii]|uniref:hypothetical protein n=1 Tax=Paenibacillus cymbidii TaxID=1639034 RepID=UPI001081D8F7|nr:hypothetical protein [Paenibacillus cymbidii]